jgi:hypothetical protein
VDVPKITRKRRAARWFSNLLNLGNLIILCLVILIVVMMYLGFTIGRR